jgi:hypothetical protein
MNAKRQAFERRSAPARDAAAAELRQALVDGALRAHLLLANGTIIEVPIEPWRTSAAGPVLSTGRLEWRHGSSVIAVPVGLVLLAESAFRRWIEPLSGTTIAAEKRLEAHLTEVIGANRDDPVSKGRLKEMAAAAGHRFSGDGFERARTNAIKAANAPKWAAKGRRKTKG